MSPSFFSVWLFISLILHTVVSAVPSSVSGNLSFMIIGDWGGQGDKPYYTEAEKYCAESMGQVAADIGSQFTLSMGDNFYENGVTDVNDKRFKETFEDVFTADSLQSKWYPVCGNHDYNGNCSAQIAYTQVSDRWHFPSFYYTETISIPGSSDSVQFVFIDTVILTGVNDGYGPHPGPSSVSDAETEWKWIETTLSQSRAKWLIVAGHYPVWSAGQHGPTEDLVKRLKPMFEKYNVTLYLSGHDHNLQHIKETNSSVNYILSGAGHGISDNDDHKDDLPANSLLFFHGRDDDDQSHGGFNSAVIDGDSMLVTFYTAKAKVVYSTSIGPRQRFKYQ